MERIHMQQHQTLLPAKPIRTYQLSAADLDALCARYGCQPTPVRVQVMPPRTHSKRVNVSAGIIDGTSYEALGTVGLKLLEQARATRNAQLRLANAKAHSQPRLHTGGMRQASWDGIGGDRFTATRSLSPAMPQWTRDTDVESTDPMWAFKGDRKPAGRRTLRSRLSVEMLTGSVNKHNKHASLARWPVSARPYASWRNANGETLMTPQRLTLGHRRAERLDCYPYPIGPTLPRRAPLKPETRLRIDVATGQRRIVEAPAIEPVDAWLC